MSFIVPIARRGSKPASAPSSSRTAFGSISRTSTPSWPARTLSQGFPEHSKITARGTHVEAIEVLLDPDHFHVARHGSEAHATHKRVVRGIALKTSQLALDRWVEMLFEALARHSNTNQRAAWVLGRLGGRC